MTDRMLTAIMYHYVRDLVNTEYPRIKALQINDFAGQLNYLSKFYTFVTVDECLEAVEGRKHLPKNPVLLTFDDGYKDHYDNVFPLLKKKGIQGCFFPVGKPVVEHTVLDTNKIHFILASAEAHKITNDIFALLDESRSRFDLNDNSHYYDQLAKKDRFDTADTIFVKRILQKGLPEALRKEIVNILFEKYVKVDEKSFASQLYLNIDEIREMREDGMYIGCHSYDHYWLDTLKKVQQEEQIDLALKFLKKLGCDLREWVMCYPYGSHNTSLRSIIKSKGCKMAFTAEVGLINLSRDDPFVLPRLDTNDLPKEEDSSPNKWTKMILD